MKKKMDLEKWPRYETFQHYDSCTNPFVILSVNIDISNLYYYAKDNNLSMYASLGYMVAKTVREFEEFRYRKEGDSIYLFDDIIPNFTENIEGKDLYFFDVDLKNNIKDFDNEFKKVREEHKNGKVEISNCLNEIWMSCNPWLSLNSLVPPFDRNNTIPQFIWDRFVIKDNKVMTNLMVLVHHGFIDGFKINSFYKKLVENIKEIKGDGRND